MMITRREAAIRLDIPLEMATRNGVGKRVSEESIAEMDANPPVWLAQSRANRRPGSKPVWVQLKCHVCSFSEDARPKKWWPSFTYVTCDYHDVDELPYPAEGLRRVEYDGVGSRFIGVADELIVTD